MKSEDSSQKFRTVEINDSQPKRYPSNSVITTKYNFITFLPLFLLNQFANYSNLFFLVIAILQQLPGVSPMGRYTTVLPLSIILTVSGIKDLYEDIIRRREDNKVNTRKVEHWTKSGWTIVQWKQVKVGEILRVKNNFEFPADLVMVCSSEAGTGIAYVETVNLDGENNLKVRRVPHSLDVNEGNLNSFTGTEMMNYLFYFTCCYKNMQKSCETNTLVRDVRCQKFILSIVHWYALEGHCNKTMILIRKTNRFSPIL